MSSLTDSQKIFLREVARQAVSAAVLGTPEPDLETLAREAGTPLEGALLEKSGAFVTLTSGGRLRGCIGFIEGFKPLVEAVADNGHSAAVGDPRFAPVSVAELDHLDLEVSALSPLRQVASFEEIEVGRHGVLLEKDGRQSVFLPQVATEQGWDRDTTLTQLALKAGLKGDSWRQGARFRVFEAEVF